MKFLRFLKSKTFFIQLGIAVIVLVVGYFIMTWSIRSYTRHNETIEVPDFSGVLVSELDNFSEGKDITYLIIDSIHENKMPKGTVVEQDPLVSTMVKSGRTIYLTVNSVLPEKIAMPNLLNLSLRQAIAIMESAGLKVGRLKYVPDIAKNAVLQQQFKGKEIKPGALIEKGSVINLVVGRGESSERVAVPNLYGLSRKQAIALLNNNSLNIGAEIFDAGADSASARVYSQKPASKRDADISLGSSVDIWYKSPDKFQAKEEDMEDID
ncbi:MAG: PASTA domain-containing protein [Bacteroidetes bacterium]|nr:PASTA domain-containing protein [Bacteroidota bacterium]MBU1719383.1 PASTA domain-containing protein [Bacteroidota bacterium]